MPKTGAFEQNTQRYEDWFSENHLAYQSELEAVRRLLPASGRGLEIGVGSGLFAAPLGIGEGLEPCEPMAQRARERGIEVTTGVAEALPYPDQSFDYALMVTTICFLDDVPAAFAEAFRVLKPGGAFLVGLVDRESPLGREYQRRKDQSAFYREATFFSTQEVMEFYRQAGFQELEVVQTLFVPPPELTRVDQVRPGFGEGSFVVLRGVRPEAA